jgi:outer membrane protein assembly factor BamB/tetratricopeptide (TPR) repeat protein
LQVTIREYKVAFKGDLKDINLADIFQTLAMNQQEGTLIITSGEKRTDIYFSKEGIRLLTTGGRKYPLIGELLLKKKKLTPVELDMALAKQKMTGELIGHALVDMKIVTEQDIEDCVRNQIEEEIHDVFSWAGAKFEFIPGEPKADFFDPAKLERPITFSANEIIMEAARRIDEWEMIRQRIPHMNAIYQVRDREAAIPDISPLGFTTEEIFQVSELVDGRKTVEDIVEKASLARFEVCKILAGFVDADYVVKLDLQQTAEIADKLYRSGDKTGAIKIYRDALVDYPDDTSVRTRLAQLYEKDEMKNEAALEYANVAENLIAQGSHREGLSLFKKALELSPRNFSIRQKLFKYYLSERELDLAAVEGLFVARTYWRMNRLDEATQTLQQIIDLVPENIEVRQMLINVLIDQQQHAAALEHYEIIAGMFAKQGNRDGLAETYRKILAIDKTRSDVRSKLTALLSKRRRRALVHGRKAVYALIMVLVLLGAVVMLLVRYELDARRGLESLSARLRILEKDRQEHEARRSDTEAGYRQLASDAEKFRRKYRFILLISGSKVDSILGTVKKRLAYFEDIRKQEADKEIAANVELYDKARQLDKEGNLDSAYLLYQKVDKGLLPQEQSIEAETRIRYLLNYLKRAKDIFEVAQAAEREQKYEEAFQNYRELLRNYSQASFVKEMKLPLLVDSEPCGADVIVDGKSYGPTPQVIKRSSQDAVNVRVRKKGYSEPDMREVEPASWRAFFKLQRTFLWTFETDGQVESAVAVSGDKVFAGTRNGVLHCIDMERGTRVWQFSPGGVFSCFPASPRASADRVYIGSLDQNIYAVDKDAGSLLWSIKLDSVVRSSPSVLDSQGRFCIGCSDHFLYCIDTLGKKVVWRFQTGKEVFSSPLLCGDTVYFGSDDHKCRAVDTESSTELWSFETDGPVNSTPSVSGDTVLFSSEDSLLYAFSAKRSLAEGEERLIWKYKTDGSAISSPVVSQGLVYFGSSDGKVYCLDLQGKVASEESTGRAASKVWEFKTDGPVTSTPAIADQVVYVGSQDGCLYALSATEGKLLWKYKVGTEPQTGKQAQILAGIVVADKHIIFPATDRKIYCFIK